ncbi:putative 2-amino-3-carboxymuconate-6-semialdehyde decarboxylase [Rosellinia necatrix]|uniref:6-methylsalicylate decarboxylase n=1 Tax=Rosellinia necatrix TaxID=77044 RepID=A0A1W2TK03_ROSNE|nr:putative 2-amino-3-carboxymuconate-6-semialdehyde decarboxylase [Rosellinia necatrix]
MLERATGVLATERPESLNTSRIDTHIHVLTPSYAKALNKRSGQASGWPIPSWSFEECVRFCDTIGASFSVLSATTPGPAILGPTEGGRRLARVLNDEIWDVCQQRPGRFGFFASLPDFNDIEGTIEEIRKIFGVDRKANGVIVMSSYGDRLVGDVAFKPIWGELNKYSALVFLHPSHMDIIPERIGGFLPQSVIDYPLATTRAAMSLLISGIMLEYDQIDVILSHAGGAFPMLAQRGIVSLVEATISRQSNINMSEAKSAAARFWYDIALSTSEAQLKALLATASSSNIVYGSDFPYAPRLAIYAGLLQYTGFALSPEGREIGPTQLHGNAKRLLKKHAPECGFLPRADDAKSEAEFELEDSDDARKAREQLDGN